MITVLLEIVFALVPALVYLGVLVIMDSYKLVKLRSVLGAIVAVGIIRIDLAIALHTQGVPWVWAHDVVLGVFYAVVVALSLRPNAWLRGPSMR